MSHKKFAYKETGTPGTATRALNPNFDRFNQFLHSGMWDEYLVPMSSTKDRVRLANVSKTLRKNMTRDEIWKPLLGVFDDGSFLLNVFKGSSTLKKTMMDAFITATNKRCFDCNDHAQFVHVFTCKKVCWECYERRFKTGDPEFALICKSKAMQIYLLNERDFSKIPMITYCNPHKPLGSAIYTSRTLVESIAFAKYDNGSDGLLADKEQRAAKAEKRYAERLAAYQAKLEEAKKNPSRKRPKRPQPSKLLDKPLDSDGGMMCDYKQVALSQVGFPSKETGLLHPDVVQAGGSLYCWHCMDADTNRKKKAFMFREYPDNTKLYDHMFRMHPEEFDDDYSDYSMKPCGCGYYH